MTAPETAETAAAALPVTRQSLRLWHGIRAPAVVAAVVGWVCVSTRGRCHLRWPALQGSASEVPYQQANALQTAQPMAGLSPSRFTPAFGRYQQYI